MRGQERPTRRRAYSGGRDVTFAYGTGAASPQNVGVSDFHIWGRIEVEGDAFVAIVSAIPTDPVDTGRTIVVREVATTRLDAVELLRQRAVDLGRQLRGNGDDVLGVEIE